MFLLCIIDTQARMCAFLFLRDVNGAFVNDDEVKNENKKIRPEYIIEHRIVVSVLNNSQNGKTRFGQLFSQKTSPFPF